ncbi:MAG TPA: hypothetical protein VIL26_04360 [Clostridia bacterium]
MKDDFLKVIAKKAQGYNVNEVVEEYVMDEEGLKLTKKKVTKKHIPPDLAAAKLLIDMEQNINEMSDQELENEINKLKHEIMEELNSGNSQAEIRVPLRDGSLPQQSGVCDKGKKAGDKK